MLDTYLGKWVQLSAPGRAFLSSRPAILARRLLPSRAVLSSFCSSMAKREDGGVDSGGRLTGRTTAMFSATMLPEVERIAKKYLRDPVIVKIGDEEAGAKNKRIEQRVLMMSEGNKKRALVEQLRLALTRCIVQQSDVNMRPQPPKLREECRALV